MAENIAIGIVTKEMSKSIKKKLQKIAKIRGGRTFVCKTCKIATSTYYRALKGSHISYKSAKTLEYFFESNSKDLLKL